MFVLAIIPARAGSKSIKNKNLVKIKNKPLISYTIEEAKKSRLINEIYISSDSRRIIELAKFNKINYVLRPKKISSDKAKTIETIKHLIKYFKKKNNFYPDYVIILQPTSPLRKSYHIDQAIKLIIKNKKSDSLVSCVKVRHSYNPNSLMKIKSDGFLKFNKKLKRRQDKSDFYARNGAAIYIIKYPVYLSKIFGKNTIPYIMDTKSSLDIDDMHDLRKLKKILR